MTIGEIAYRVYHEMARWTASYTYRYHNYGSVIVSPEECADDLGGDQPWYNCRFFSHYNGFGHELDFIGLMRTYWIRLKESDEAVVAAARVSAALGYDVEAFVDAELFARACDFITRPAVEDLSAGNLLGWIDTFAALAMDYERTDWIQFLYEYESYGTRWYGRDGVYMESYMYAQHAMDGYSEGVTLLSDYFALYPDSPAIALKVEAEALQTFANLGHGNILQVEQPNRQWPANGDNQREGFTGEGTSRSGENARYDAAAGVLTLADGTEIAVTRSNASALLPAYGGVALRSRSGHGATQVNVEAARGGVWGHCPEAVNTIQLTAFGRSPLDHERYQRTRTRYYRAFTGAWNTVVVNQRTSMGWKWKYVDESNRLYYGALPPIDASASPYSASGGDVVLFEKGAGGVSVVESDGYRAYYPWTSRYTRFVAHDDSDPDHPYTLDVFRVVGGQHHEFMLHGDTQMDQEASTSFPVAPLEGRTPLVPEGYDWEYPPWTFGFDQDDPRWYGLYRNVSAGAPTAEFAVTWAGACDGLELPLCGEGETAPALKIWGLSHETANATTTAYVARDPHNWRYDYPDDGVDVLGDDQRPAAETIFE